MRSDHEEIIDRYRLADRQCADFYYRLSSEKDYERRLFIPDLASKASHQQELAKLQELVEVLPEPEPQFTVVKGFLKEFLTSAGWKLTALYTDPLEALHPLLWKWDDMYYDHRSQKEQEALLLDVYAQLPALWQGIQTWYSQTDAAHLQRSISTLQEFQTGFRKIEFSDPQLTEMMDLTIRRMDSCIAELTRLLSHKGETGDPLPDAVRTLSMPREEYRTLLRDLRGVDLDELLRWGTSEMEKTRSRCFDMAGHLADSKGEPRPETMEQVNSLLFRHAGPCDSPEEMFQRAESYLKRTRALAHEYVRLPEDERCLIAETPWTLRESYPWGGYGKSDTEGRPLVGKMFLNQYNYTAVTDGWIRMNCLHEAYPGHHVQFVRSVTDPLPETMKIGARNIPMIEGMCHRTEHIFEFIYDEDPFFPLFVAYRQHHTAVRIQADLLLYYYGRPVEEAVQLYEKELGFDRRTAQGQVLAQENMPGYFTCYYYGMKKLCDWETQYGFDVKEYTELLFSLSHISLDTFEKVLKLTEAQREHFLHDFASLYMDPEETFF